jgi:hypothetical protein
MGIRHCFITAQSYTEGSAFLRAESEKPESAKDYETDCPSSELMIGLATPSHEGD